MPEPGGMHIVLAPCLDVVYFKIMQFEISNRHAEMIEFSPGKDVAADRGRQSGVTPAAATKALETLRAQRNRMVEVQAARFQQAIDGLEIGRMVGDADVFEHADRSNLVKAAFEM